MITPGTGFIVLLSGFQHTTDDELREAIANLKKDGMRTDEVLGSLTKDAKVVGGSAQFEGGTGGGWIDHHTEVSAAALRALIACDPKHELVPKLVAWLAHARQGNYWASTKQTAMVVYAFVDYLALTGDLNPDMQITLSVNGDQVYSEHVTRANWQKFDGMRKFNASQLNAGRASELPLHHPTTARPASPSVSTCG